MAQSFWEKLAKKTGQHLLSEGVGSAEFNGYMDTGSYALNIISSGSLFNGIPNNSFTGLAGESTTGKTFFALAIAKHFQTANPTGGVWYADSESAFRKAMAENRGMGSKQIIREDFVSVEDFRTGALKTIDAYEGMLSEDNSPPFLFILDSLGGLSTNKELEDTATFGDTKEAEKRRNTKDMTRAPLIKGTFRVLRLKMAKLKIPMLITNHVYANIGGYGAQQVMGGGCLVADTKIQTPDGAENIQNIKIGDKVSTIFGDKLVTKTFKFEKKRLFEVEFEDGSKIKCSGDHRFLIDGKWKSVFDMLDGVKDTKNINIDVADIKGDINVFRKQVYENLFCDHEESAEA